MTNKIIYATTLPDTANIGDIVFLKNIDSLYVYTGSNKFQEILCNSAHERGIPTNCKNCGAVLTSYKCEYCGTEY